jgi:hypothetical protein
MLIRRCLDDAREMCGSAVSRGQRFLLGGDGKGQVLS